MKSHDSPMDRPPETPASDNLPSNIEDAVLLILEGDDGARSQEIEALLIKHPKHALLIRNWLVSAGAMEPAVPELEFEGVDDGRLPCRLGAYVLQEVIGRGGFGTVYRAEQQEPIRRPVAIKVLNPGMDSRDILARFTAEREALNRMDHPGIARLIDAGTTSKQRPFFVMELVEGPTLIAYCRREAISLQKRIELFLQVCDGMQHAHQKSVLHRDLSSNNVLITSGNQSPQPKIIDFGIAKSLTDPLLQGGAMTFQGTLMGTPEFMSPEQAAGRINDIDTRADVYSLGVQLFELLTDQLPIPGVVLRAQGLAGMANVIATHAPPRASEVAPPTRRAQLRGDLEGILQTSLAKERGHRYAGVGEFAADLRHYLANEPIAIATPTTWYKLRKFVRRNRGQSIVVGSAFAGMCTALVFMAMALSKASREAELKDQATLEVKAKADAGFRLLANEDRIDRARATEALLPPPWPDHMPAYEEWRSNFAELLQDQEQRVADRLAALERQRAKSDGQLTDDVDRHLERALTRLQQQLATFLGSGGLAAKVAARQAWCQTTLVTGDAQSQKLWRQAHDAIKASDGKIAAHAYGGLQIPQLAGLEPLGCHPKTKLWEFLDLRSHEPDYPLPVRDLGTGDLQADAGTGVILVLLPHGRIAIGARRNQPGMDRNDDYAAIDELNDAATSLKPFLIARTEMTIAQWTRLTGSELPNFDPQLPVSNVDWQTAVSKLRRWGLTLPTEMQWEYACRAGTTTPWSSGADPESAKKAGWLDGQVRRVAQLNPNPFGLFDLHGNVAEWCLDEKLPYIDFAPQNFTGLRTRTETTADAWRVIRGGSVHDGAISCRSTARDQRAPKSTDNAVGIRPVRVLTPR